MFRNKKILKITGAVAIVVLASISVVTAVIITKPKTEPLTSTTPEEAEACQKIISCDTFFFSINPPETPTPTPTPVPSSTLTPTPTFTPTPTATSTPIPSSTPTATPTGTPVPSSTPTATPTATSTPIPSSTPTSTPTPTQQITENSPTPTQYLAEATPTTQPTKIAYVTETPGGDILPDAGISLPFWITIMSGFILIWFSILLFTP